MGRREGHTGLEPSCAALVVCDYVHTDPVSGRFAVLGSFQEIVADEFPVTYPNLGIYVALSDGRGVCTISLRLIDVDEDKTPVLDEASEADLSNPQDLFEFGVNIPDVPFDEPGIYRVQLMVDGATIVERSIKLSLAEFDQE